MKKLKLLIFILVMFLTYTVNANNNLELVCTTPKILEDGYTNCDIMLTYDTPVSMVEFNYESDMLLTFTKGASANLDVTNDKVVLTYTDTFIPKNIKILNVKIVNNDNQVGNKKVSLKNVRVTSNDVSYSLNNQEQDIAIVSSSDLSSNCNLNKLTIDGIDVTGFSPSKYNYNKIVTNNRVVFLDAVRSDELSSVTGLGNVLLKENEEKEVNVTVTAENGSKCIYKLGITYVKKDIVESNVDKEVVSNNNNLDNIELFYQDEKINYTFDVKKNNYDINVENKVNTLSIKAILQDEKASFVSKFGPRNVNLNEGKNTFLIKVEALNGDIKTYTLNITRDKTKSGDITLKSLIINDVEVELKSNEFDYEINLPDIYDETDISAVANDNNSKITYKNINLTDENKVLIKVKAENGDVGEYNITVNQEEKVEKEEKTILPFEKIEVVGYDLKFDINKSEYELKIASDVTSLDFKVVPENIDITILNNINLRDGSIVTVKVIDGVIERSYQIKIIKDASMNTNILCYLFFISAIIILLVSFWYRVKIKK